MATVEQSLDRVENRRPCCGEVRLRKAALWTESLLAHHVRNHRDIETIVGLLRPRHHLYEVELGDHPSNVHHVAILQSRCQRTHLAGHQIFSRQAGTQSRIDRIRSAPVATEIDLDTVHREPPEVFSRLMDLNHTAVRSKPADYPIGHRQQIHTQFVNKSMSRVARSMIPESINPSAPARAKPSAARSSANSWMSSCCWEVSDTAHRSTAATPRQPGP